MSIFNDAYNYEVMRILKSKDISLIIEKIKETPENISVEEWNEWSKKFSLGRNGYRAVVMEMLRCKNCPSEFRDKILMSTSDKDVMFAGLLYEDNPVTIKFLLTNIGKTYMKDIENAYAEKGRLMPLSHTATQICAVDYMKIYDYVFLKYCDYSAELEKRIKKEGLTESAATYLLNNRKINANKKIEKFNEYGYDFSGIDFKQLPVQITNELFNVSMETIFSNEEIDKHLKKQARDAIMTMYEENMLSSFQLDDFCKKFEELRSFDKNSRENRKLYTHIVTTSKDPMVYKHRTYTVAYRNPNWDVSWINEKIKEEIKKLVATNISDPQYDLIQKDIANDLLFGRVMDKNTLKMIIYHLKSINPETNSYRNQEIAIALVSNPRVSIDAKSPIIRNYADNSHFKTKTELNILADMCTLLRYSTRDRNESEYDNAIIYSFTNEEIDYLMSIPAFIKGMDVESMTKEKRYFDEIQVKELKKVRDAVIKRCPDAEIKNAIDCVVQLAEHNHKAQFLYKEYGRLFTDKSKYQLPPKDDEKTIDILKIDKFSKKDMMEIYQSIDDEYLLQLKEIIEKAVQEQTNVGLQYYLYPKYKKQYDIIEEVLFQRENERVRIPDIEDELCI